MKFEALPLRGAYAVDLELRGDERGFFARTFCVDEFAAQGLPTDWVQCNMSFSAKAGTIRGLHFQRPPMAETKLVRCTRGAIFDVIVDLRLWSITYGQWHGERLDDGNRRMIYVPEGFAACVPRPRTCATVQCLLVVGKAERAGIDVPTTA